MRFAAKLFTAFFGTLVLTGGQAQAVPLSDLVGGGSITAGDKSFTDWSLVGTPSAGIDLTFIEVSALSDPASNPGLRFSASNGTLTATDGQLDLDFRYTVSAPSPLIKGASLALSEFDLTGNGSVSIFQDILDLTSTPIEANAVFAGPGSQQLFDAATLALTRSVMVATSINVAAGPEERAALVAFEERFSQVQVPEPGALALLLSGLIALAALIRRRA